MRDYSIYFNFSSHVGKGAKMEAASHISPREIQGITYCYSPAGAVLTARDGKVTIPLDEFPLPLLNEDYVTDTPSYDAVGRGIYQLLRIAPDAPFADRYATLLKDAYPHLLAELATHLVMLDKKDVDLPYLDRKISYLKIFALLEPDNHRFPLEIGATLFDKALTLAALGNTTLHLFSAEKYLRMAHQLNPADVQTRYLAGEVCFLLGKYSDAVEFWRDIGGSLPADETARIERRLARITSGSLPAVPAVDYLQVVGVALEAFEAADYEEAAAIILDLLDVVSSLEEFPLAEINYLLGLCYLRLDIPKYAEQYLRQAVELRPGYTEALQELALLGVQ
jgi:tetratricopeptide (TPR) repeat protein